MKLEYMKELLTLEQYRNYTSAAEKLYITQPALSRHISALERELGTVLVIRNTHLVEFTPEGKEACKTFRKILNLYDNYYSKLQEARAGMTGTLRLGMLYYTVSQDFGTILPAFQKLYPHVSIKSISCQPQEIYQALLDDKIDIGVLAKAGYPQNKLLHFREFQRTKASAMLSSSHPLASRNSILLEELKAESIVLLRDDPCSTQSILEAFSRCDFVPAQTVYADQIDLVPFTVLETNGIHINGGGFSIPGFETQIRVIPIKTPQLYFSKAFAWRTDNSNPIVPLFLNMLDV